MNRLVIAIDGPAASGKGTLARRIAAAFNLPYLDTGLLYRAVARRMLDRDGEAGDAEAEEDARTLNRVDLTRLDLRTPEVDRAASAIASNPLVREALLGFQHDFARTAGAVVDGRDIGTIVFPDAQVKIFITASLDVRAARRLIDQQAADADVTLADVRAELAARDEADRNRRAAPLKPAPDATILDTSELDIDHAFAQAAAIVGKALGELGTS